MGDRAAAGRWTRYVQRAGFLGREIRSLFEVIELDPGKRVTIDTLEGTSPSQ